MKQGNYFYSPEEVVKILNEVKQMIEKSDLQKANVKLGGNFVFDNTGIVPYDSPEPPTWKAYQDLGGRHIEITIDIPNYKK